MRVKWMRHTGPGHVSRSSAVYPEKLLQTLYELKLYMNYNAKSVWVFKIKCERLHRSFQWKFLLVPISPGGCEHSLLLPGKF